MGRESGVELARRLDSWANALTGLGTSRDKTAWMQPGVVVLLSPQQLENMYHTDDIATRIIRAVVDEAYREGFTVMEAEGDEADGIDPGERDDAEDAGGAERLRARMKELEAYRKLKEARIWGRLYGKGALLLGANDGQSPDKPLNEDGIVSFDFITVLDRRDLTPKSWYADISDEKFGQIATYYVQPVGVYMGQPYDGIATNPPVEWHESRMIIFGGELTGKRQRLANQGCDYSILQKCFRALQLTNNNWQSASTLLADAGQGVFKIRGLIDMIAQNPEVMNSRMQLVDQMRSTVRAIILDAGDEKGKTPPEDFTRVATPFTGIPEMLRETWNRLACTAEMPLWKLMGSAPGSLQGSEEEGQEDWYNSVEAQQREIDIPAIERILMLIARAEGIPGEWTGRPGMLRRMSPPQVAKSKLDLANAFKALVDVGIYMPEEVALSLDKDPTGQTMLIDVDARRALLKASVSAAKAEREQVVKEAKAPVVAPKAPAAGR